MNKGAQGKVNRVNISLDMTVDIHQFKPVLEGLIDVFDYKYYHTILCWCGVITPPPIHRRKTLLLYLIKTSEFNCVKTLGMIGIYSMKTADDSEMWLSWFGILPKFRNQRVGKKALRLAEKEAKKRGAKWMYVHTQSEVDDQRKSKNGSEEFYQREGYKYVSSVSRYRQANGYTEGYFEGGLMDNVYRKKL